MKNQRNQILQSKDFIDEDDEWSDSDGAIFGGWSDWSYDIDTNPVVNIMGKRCVVSFDDWDEILDWVINYEIIFEKNENYLRIANMDDIEYSLFLLTFDITQTPRDFE